MRKKILFLILPTILLVSAPPQTLYTYIYTKDPALIKSEQFKFSVGVSEYYRKNIGSVFEVPLAVHLGLSRKIEFIGIFPYLQLRHTQVRNIDTFGDLMLFLKIHLKTFGFRSPFSTNEQVRNQWDLIMGFNTATGPSANLTEGKYFSPYSIGIPDFRVGFLYGFSTGAFSLDFDFIYTFAAQLDEEYLPFKSTLWSSKDKVYVFGLVNVLVKFLWPGRYPFAPKEAPKWEKYPHIDDFFNFNTGLKYHMAPSWLYFSYELFLELNWLKSWSKYSIYPSYLLFTPGINVNLTDSISIIGGLSFIAAEHVYQYETIVNEDSTTGEKIIIEKPMDFYFEKLYFIGIKFLL